MLCAAAGQPEGPGQGTAGGQLLPRGKSGGTLPSLPSPACPAQPAQTSLNLPRPAARSAPWNRRSTAARRLAAPFCFCCWCSWPRSKCHLCVFPCVLIACLTALPALTAPPCLLLPCLACLQGFAVKEVEVPKLKLRWGRPPACLQCMQGHLLPPLPAACCSACSLATAAMAACRPAS